MDVNSHNAINLRTTSSFALNRAANTACQNKARQGVVKVIHDGKTYEVTVKKENWYSRPEVVEVKLNGRTVTSSNAEGMEESKQERFRLGAFRGGSNFNRAIKWKKQRARSEMNAIMKCSTQGFSGADSERTKELIQSGLIDINCADYFGNTLLHLAAKSNNSEIVGELIAAKVDLNQQGENGQTALMAAIREGNTEVVRRVIDAGADPNIRDNSGQTAIMLAVQTGNSEIVKLLLKNGADPNIRDNSEQTALMKAVNAGNLEIMKLLVNGGADFKAKDQYERTALNLANTCTPIMEYLRAQEEVSEIIEGGVFGENPQNSWERIKELIQNRSIDVNFKSPYNDNTLLHWAVKNNTSENNTLGIVGELIKLRADVNRTSDNGKTALMFAVKTGNSEIVKLLLENGADPNIRDNSGQTAIMFAAQTGNSEIVKLLLENRADPNIRDNSGQTATMFAAQTGNSEIVKLLLENGANPNLTDNTKQTATMKAVNAGNLEIMKLLVNGGADFKAKDQHGRTALDLANTCTPDAKRTPIMEYLKAQEEVSKIIEGGVFGKNPQNSWERIKELIQNGSIDVNFKSPHNGNTLLHWAVKNNTSENDTSGIVGELIKLGADVNRTSDNGNTALMEAATNGNLKMVQYLVENSADVNHAKPGWDTPAQAAIRSNRNPQVIQYLLNRPDIDLNKTGGGGETLSETAIRVGNKDAFGILLNKCSEDQLNELNQNDLTPLMMAALLGRLDMVKELVERGAEIDARNSNGDTASLLAASVRGKDIMEFLKQHGASQQTTNRAGLTADQLLKKMEIQEHDRGVLKKLDKLLKPDMSEEDVENIKKLIETIKSRDNLNMVYEEGCTILGVAAFSGNRDIVTLLTDRGAKVCITNEAFRRPFQSAIDNGDVAMLKLLFKKGGEQGNPINPQWFLCMAAGSAKIEVVRFLVNEGADVNTESPDWDWFSGLSPSEVVQGSLRSATRNKKKGEIKILNQIMTLLEECGANP